MRIMTKTILTTAVAICGAATAVAGEAEGKVTFHKDVEPILQKNCQTCHRPSGMNLSGMIAPMSLMDYAEVRPWAKAVAKAVEARQMPPWNASAKHNGKFSNERVLTDTEIATLGKWIAQGASKGNPADAPAPMTFPESGWNMGTPDLIVDFDKPYFVADDVEDLYQNITVTLTDAQLSEDKWISGIEFRPGSEVVHHIMGYKYSPGEQAGDQARGLLGGNAPGADAGEFPEGYGMLLKKGSSLTFALHYHKESGPGTGVYDSSQMAFKFHDKPVMHEVKMWNISYGSFEIPPFEKKWRVGASQLFEEDTMLLGLMPHTHLRGVYAKYMAFYPDGKVEELLEVPTYDFNWQTTYKYKDIKVLPKGTRMEMELHFDNSAENAERGKFNPAQTVRFGGPTTDEMDLAWITTAPAAELDLTTKSAAATTGD